jgi:hypothetical protein
MWPAKHLPSDHVAQAWEILMGFHQIILQAKKKKRKDQTKEAKDSDYRESSQLIAIVGTKSLVESSQKG